MDQKSKIGVKNWIMIVILGFAGQLCWAVENNTFATYALASTGNAAVVTWMVALSALSTTIATFISGTLGDRLGKRKKLISIGLILWGVFTVVFGLADFIPKNQVTFISVYVVLMDCVMSFFGSIGYSGGVQPWTTDISDETNRGSVATVLAALVIVANIVVQGLQGMIVDAVGFMPIFVVIGALVTVIGIITIFTIKDAENLKPSVTHKSFFGQLFSAFNFKETFRNKKLLWVLVTICVYTCGFNIYMSYSSSYLYYYFGEYSGVALTKTNASLIQGGGMLVATALSFLFMKPINRGKEALITAISVILSVVSLVLLSVSKSVPMLAIFITLSALGYIMNLQATTAWFKNLCPENMRGSVEGVKQIFYVLVPMVVGPLLALLVINALQVTVIVDGIEIQAPTNTLFLVAGLFTVLTFIPLWFACKKGKENG